MLAQARPTHEGAARASAPQVAQQGPGGVRGAGGRADRGAGEHEAGGRDGHVVVDVGHAVRRLRAQPAPGERLLVLPRLPALERHVPRGRAQGLMAQRRDVLARYSAAGSLRAALAVADAEAGPRPVRRVGEAEGPDDDVVDPALADGLLTEELPLDTHAANGVQKNAGQGPRGSSRCRGDRHEAAHAVRLRGLCQPSNALVVDGVRKVRGLRA
mmetsp:Transcript_19269/g.54428  ORF Transcript_19269/g.54428 Transcript_19269/m.54428 type:complete len:214 (+) Transcript_19269:107-748(+)